MFLSKVQCLILYLPRHQKHAISHVYSEFFIHYIPLLLQICSSVILFKILQQRFCLFDFSAKLGRLTEMKMQTISRSGNRTFKNGHLQLYYRGLVSECYVHTSMNCRVAFANLVGTSNRKDLENVSFNQSRNFSHLEIRQQIKLGKSLQHGIQQATKGTDNCGLSQLSP